MTIEGILSILIGILGFLVVFVFPIYLLFGGLRTIALRPLRRCFDGIETHNPPLPGDAVFVYHTYRGLLVWLIQEEHHVAASPVNAERLLARLLRFNLTWGMLSYGMLFIPFFAVPSYFSQRRAIRRQAESWRAMGIPDADQSRHAEPGVGADSR